ncbi:unnamed protein product [Soboliphyme baturini]|uniref:beta-ketoacyl-[acyl-carrier-protein] synthase I n=1 Tax=Soboliphyme baturini TaxID=241478 RepID=A0A183J5A1_9BILA|nr:unnamed protein product [Soboliphyme baturini]
MAGGQVGIKYGLHGPNHCVSTACATGCHAIGDGFILIKRHQADVMVCGSTEAPIVPLTVAGFCRLRALCTTFNDDASKASRPFDIRRGGFVIGEGSGVVILEELSHAKHRNAKIYGEVLGYGLSGDGFHLTMPDAEGRGTVLCMSRALKDAGVKPADIGYINAHATSTKLGDEAECKSISKVMHGNDHLLVSSTKGATGHLLGAAGSLEAIFTILACNSGKIPPNLNLEKTDIEAPVKFAPSKTVNWLKIGSRRIGLCNSFGFGGTNATLCVANFVD